MYPKLYFKFKNSDYQLLPQRFKDDCVGGESCGLTSKHYDYVITPNTDKCKTANVVVTIKSAADHFGELYNDADPRTLICF